VQKYYGANHETIFFISSNVIDLHNRKVMQNILRRV